MTEKLLLEIARCPIAERCLSGARHLCSKIVRVQRSLAKHQVPEPWSGQLGEAPILFISSNPSLSDEDVFPTWSWPDDRIVDYFSNRFSGGDTQWIKDGTKGLGKDDTYRRATPFWSSIRQRAGELYGRDVKPGIDYALTEIVHCKSRGELGVAEAMTPCIRHYLERLVQASVARVLVVLGAHAKHTIKAELGISDESSIAGPAEFFGRWRMLTFLPHPNARTKRTFSTCVTEEELAILRNYLTD